MINKITFHISIELEKVFNFDKKVNSTIGS